MVISGSIHLKAFLRHILTGTMGQSIDLWESINAELMLFVFLPPLVFGEAMSLNWYHLKGGLLQSLILAGPGVLIGAALVFPSLVMYTSLCITIV